MEEKVSACKIIVIDLGLWIQDYGLPSIFEGNL